MQLIKFITFLVLAGSMGCGQHDADRHPELVVRQNLEFASTPRYESCQALSDQVKADREAQDRAAQEWYKNHPMVYSDTAADSASSAESASPTASTAAPKDVLTNLQEAGVDEEDLFRVGSEQMFISLPVGIEVLERKDLTSVGRIAGTTGRPALYIDDHHLLALSSLGSGVKLSVYKTAAGALPTLLAERTYEGTLADSRLVDGRLTLAMTVQFDYNKISGDSVNGVACSSVIQNMYGDNSYNFTKVVTVDTRSEGLTETSVGMLGGHSHMYMTTKGLYLTREFSGNQYQSGDDSSFVTRIALGDSGKPLKIDGTAKIAGHIKDQFAFQEFADDHVLAVATTSGHLSGYQDEEHLANYLWTLSFGDDAGLKVLAQSEPFGRGEDIRSVRYRGETAYVVTFKKTDPLFAFDLTAKDKPVMLGELKIPGFSTYMQDVGDGKLVGLGFDADDQGSFAWYQGLKVALFDAKNPRELAELDHVIIGDRGSYSEATNDHHAFYFDEASHQVAFPVVDLVREGSEKGGWEMANQLKASGAVFYEVGDKLKAVGQVSHRDFLPPGCVASIAQARWWQDDGASLDVRRIMKVDGRIVTFSDFGVKAYGAGDLATPLASVKFTGMENACASDSRYRY